MTTQEVTELYGDIHELLRTTAKEEIAKELRVGGERSFTMLVDGKKYVPLRAAKRKVEFNFLAELSTEMLKVLRRLSASKSYIAATRRSGALGAEWEWYLNGSPIGSPETIQNFGAEDYLWLVSKVPYAVKAQQYTRAIAQHSIIAHVARAMRKKRAFKEFAFRASYLVIDGRRTPLVSVRLKAATKRSIISGILSG